jgi:hypothetical protein
MNATAPNAPNAYLSANATQSTTAASAEQRAMRVARTIEQEFQSIGDTSDNSAVPETQVLIDQLNEQYAFWHELQIIAAKRKTVNKQLRDALVLKSQLSSNKVPSSLLPKKRGTYTDFHSPENQLRLKEALKFAERASLRDAEERFDIPKSTIAAYSKKGLAASTRMAINRALSHTEELKLINHILTLGQRGLGLTRKEIMVILLFE